ncbi:hypothetical protein DFH27DRAFT_285884 [Peziza echinospora]|nr:hypothetical protein DFH27DRAFT_285884 [Peziza echinospora]
MGQCSSLLTDCLGIEKDETSGAANNRDSLHSHLLPNNDHHNQYNTFDNGGNRGSGGRGDLVDPQDQVREREALERIVNTATMNLIDISQQNRATYNYNNNAYYPQQYISAAPTNKRNSGSNNNNNTTTPPTATPGSLGGGGGVGMQTNNMTHDSKKMALYRQLLQRTSPPVVHPMPEVLSPSVVTKEERAWLEEVGEAAERAVGCLVRVREVGRVVVGLELDGR